MAVTTSTQPSLRARVLPRFPANVLAGNGMSITRQGGAYVFSTVSSAIPLASLEPIGASRLVGRDVGDGPPMQIAVSGGLGFSGANSLEITLNSRLRVISIVLPSMTVGLKQDYVVPFSCVITRATLLADVTGSCVIDIWKAPFASFPPTVANTITGGAKPTIAASNKFQTSTLTGWTTVITANDCLRFNVDSVTTIGRLTVALEVLPT
jgi:hypothetical protein